MNTSNTFKSYLVALSVAAVSVFTGCASTPAQSLRYSCERLSFGGVGVENVRITRTAGGIRVSGSVGRSVGYDGSSRRHLDVETIAPDGSVFSRVTTTFHSNPIRRSRHSRTSARYSVTLPEAPPAGSLVRVSIHAASRSDCHD